MSDDAATTLITTTKSEWYDYVLENSIDIKHRRIYFGDFGDEDSGGGGAVTWSSIETAVRALHILVGIDAEKPIEIHCSSFGGDVYDALRFIDEIQACPCKTIFVGGGKIMSAATMIMVVCDERRVQANSSIMVHDGNCYYGGSITDVKIVAAHEIRLDQIINKLYTDNTHMSSEFWETVCKRDVYLTAEESLVLGLVDTIIQPIKRTDLRNRRRSNKKKIDKLQNELFKRIHLV